MARSLIGGLIQDGFPSRQIWVSEPDSSRREELAQDFAIHTTADNIEATRLADLVVLAVKPQFLAKVCTALAPGLQDHPAVVMSIAAGIRTTSLADWLGEGIPLVRAMPNTPAMVQSGATALFATTQVSPAQRDLAESVMRTAGLTLWLQDEELMDAVTALSGSGPAYYFLFMEAMEAAAQRLGLPADTARLLTLQTAFGAAKMALESAEEPALLRQRVTSPGGTTEQALKVMEEAGLRDIIDQALQAAARRATELSTLLGQKESN